MAKPTISTGTGDDGTTGLLMGQRVSKDSPRVHVLGALDELNAVIGVLLTEELPQELQPGLEKLQRALFTIGSEVASSKPNESSLSASHVLEIEEWAAGLERALPKLRRFIIPGGSKVSALLHHARAICRRAERWTVALNREGQTNGFPLTGTPFPQSLRSSGGAHETHRFARSLTDSPNSSVSDTASQSQGINTNVLVYLNRLSDCLFLAARMANRAAGKKDVEV